MTVNNIFKKSFSGLKLLVNKYESWAKSAESPSSEGELENEEERKICL